MTELIFEIRNKNNYNFSVTRNERGLAYSKVILFDQGISSTKNDGVFQYNHEILENLDINFLDEGYEITRNEELNFLHEGTDLIYNDGFYFKLFLFDSIVSSYSDEMEKVCSCDLDLIFIDSLEIDVDNKEYTLIISSEKVIDGRVNIDPSKINYDFDDLILKINNVSEEMVNTISLRIMSYNDIYHTNGPILIKDSPRFFKVSTKIENVKNHYVKNYLENIKQKEFKNYFLIDKIL
ncbi:hypothetical protein Bp8pS_144 [Bacillus phage vB_BpuM-BpSp]|nr:hypothetical protein Bp8pS_144 [Bacillus phage vB_BpuM-BpSp]